MHWTCLRPVAVPISFKALLGNFHRQWQVFSGLVTSYYSLSYTFLIRILKLFHLASLANDLSNFLMYLSCYVFNWLSTFFPSLMDFDVRAEFKTIFWHFKTSSKCSTSRKLLNNRTLTFQSRILVAQKQWKPPNSESTFLSCNYSHCTGSLGNLGSFFD